MALGALSSAVESNASSGLLSRCYCRAHCQNGLRRGSPQRLISVVGHVSAIAGDNMDETALVFEMASRSSRAEQVWKRHTARPHPPPHLSIFNLQNGGWLRTWRLYNPAAASLLSL